MMSCCIFFFFKQKTAYEMRISDWSSDVCSSDLAQKVEGQEDGLHLWRAGFGLTYNAELRAERKERAGSIVDADAQRYRRFTGPEIGRASCRERVCQYV